MAHQEHLARIKQGVEVWNQWRQHSSGETPDFIEANLSRTNLIRVNLSGAYLNEADLSGAYLIRADFSEANLIRTNLSEANLSGANLSGTYLIEANFNKANLNEANLSGAYLIRADLGRTDLSKANLSGANFSGADLSRANLSRANLSAADLRGANLREASLIEANLQGANLSEANLRGVNLNKVNLTQANLSDCRIYGISVWDVTTDDTTNQSNLIITPHDKLTIAMDNLKVAQFIYLLMNNQEIRDVIDAVARKLVLILGRFPSERKAVLDAIRDALRKQNYLPVLLDIENAGSHQHLMETVSILACIARFVIADFTDAKIVLDQIQYIVRDFDIPVKPLTLSRAGEKPVVLDTLRGNHRVVLETYEYTDAQELFESLEKHILALAEVRSKAFRERTQQIKV